MNKKIGIVTFHNALSYGAMLQAYALQNYLFSLDIDNEIIDYSCDYMINHYQKVFRPYKSNFIKGTAYNLLTASNIIKERKTRDSFVYSNLKLSPKCSRADIFDIADKYCAFISGSDQVWSPTCVGFDPTYFLDFASPCQKFSYSASIACKEIPLNLQEDYKHRLSQFRTLSVREQSATNIIKDLTGRNAQVHIDPTLLLNKTQWDKLATKTTDERYILLFTVLKPVNLINYAIELHRKTGLKIKYLSKIHCKKFEGAEFLSPVTADEFVSLVKNAEYVCTNSFHGTAFSIIYHKNFVCEVESGSKPNIRSKELMTYLGIDNRLLQQGNIPNIGVRTNWEDVDCSLNRQREIAKDYLLSIRDLSYDNP